MSTVEVKEELRALIDKGSPGLLELLLEVAREYASEDCTKPGFPMGKEELIQRVSEAKSRIDAGEFVPMDELEKEMENW